MGFVSDNGNLKVRGGKLVNRSGQSVQLRGMSLYWSQWGHAFWNEHTVSNLVHKWGCTVIRCPIGYHDIAHGYVADLDAELNKLYRVVDAAVKEDVYVIVDCHDHDVRNHTVEATYLFDIVSTKYRGVPNVIYEVVNEPLDMVWADIKFYATSMLNLIRFNSPESLVLVGTPAHCSDLYEVILDPIQKQDVMYTYHFYAASHKEDQMAVLEDAAIRGIPLFVSECGVSEFTGDGVLDYASFDNWLDLLDKKGISWLGWSLFDKDEASCALLPSAPIDGTWKESDISNTGCFFRNRINNNTSATVSNGGIYTPFYPVPNNGEELLRLNLVSMSKNTVATPSHFMAMVVEVTLSRATDSEAELFLMWLANSWTSLDTETRVYIVNSLNDKKKTLSDSPENWIWFRLIDSVEYLRKGNRIK
jgi:endoglucanase